MTTVAEGGRVIVITGAMAAGKSTVAELLARRLPSSVHIRGDVFRKMVVNGRVDMSPDAGPEAMAQLHLRYALAGHTADAYAAAGFDAIVQDVIIGAELAGFVERIRTPERYLVVLSPTVSALEWRERQRAKEGYPHFSPVCWTRCCAARPPRSATGWTPRPRPRTRPSTTSWPTWSGPGCSMNSRPACAWPVCWTAS